MYPSNTIAFKQFHHWYTNANELGSVKTYAKAKLGKTIAKVRISYQDNLSSSSLVGNIVIKLILKEKMCKEDFRWFER